MKYYAVDEINSCIDFFSASEDITLTLRRQEFVMIHMCIIVFYLYTINYIRQILSTIHAVGSCWTICSMFIVKILRIFLLCFISKNN